jgi:DNA-binding response OmpR family regulator
VTENEIRVVIIDDDKGVLDVLGEAVTAFGYRAFPAKNAVQGLREVRERRPHVVLLDLTMPGLDGHTVFEHLTSSPAPPSIVIVSGNSDERDARALLQRGAFDYITKPVDLSHLQSVIIAAAAAAPPPGP